MSGLANTFNKGTGDSMVCTLPVPLLQKSNNLICIKVTIISKTI